ncbi:CarboxypepD_reg-like domain-containing protein [Chitinophaga eiseniae]|uniref:CarboxypepD_reg-like domain-containing protein n=1 Tax=Chitinophaga eiseniae TaxID=634771 RepID=A0A1T4RX85_9BACT|nr:carboxypeptidase-like regulatory domain-containing protein [Chitinophaga eiseniae]SKA20614.1 CarboxypepD_reg-like domain-containing protein [Chitinophaga eiseniae]
MRKTSLTVSIPSPCQQSWENMTPAAGGRFCGSCQKTVVDFSGLTDSQIHELLSDTSQRYCGRFRKSQLDRQIQPEQQAASLLPAAVLGALLAAGLPATAAAAGDHAAQMADTATTRTITGKVTVENGQLMPGVSLVVKGTNKGAVTDVNGYYRLTIPVLPADQKVTVVVDCIGFKRTEMAIAAEQTVDVVLKDADAQLSGEVVVVGGVRRNNTWQRFKYKWRKFWHR